MVGGGLQSHTQERGREYTAQTYTALYCDPSLATSGLSARIPEKTGLTGCWEKRAKADLSVRGSSEGKRIGAEALARLSNLSHGRFDTEILSREEHRQGSQRTRVPIDWSVVTPESIRSRRLPMGS